MPFTPRLGTRALLKQGYISVNSAALFHITSKDDTIYIESLWREG